MGKNRIIIQLTVGLVVLMTAQLVLLFISSREQVFDSFGFKNMSDFGTTAGAVSTFVVGILSAVLIYISFKAQTEANRKQFEIIDIQKNDLIEQRKIFTEEKRKNERKEKLEEIKESIDRFLREVNEFKYRASSGSLISGSLGVFFLVQDIRERLLNRTNEDPFDNYEIGFLKTISLQARQTLLTIHESNLDFKERKDKVEEFDRIYSSRIAYNFSEIAIYYISDRTKRFNAEQDFLEDFKACYDILKYYSPVSSYLRFALMMKSVEIVGGNFYWNDIAFSLFNERYFSHPKFSIFDSNVTDYKESLIEILNHLILLIQKNDKILTSSHKEWIMAARISLNSDFKFRKPEQEEFKVSDDVIQAQINYNNFDIDQLLTQVKFTIELLNKDFIAANLTVASINRTLINTVEAFSIIELKGHLEFERIEYPLLTK